MLDFAAADGRQSAFKRDSFVQQSRETVLNIEERD
jgi:hypothetical protein